MRYGTGKLVVVLAVFFVVFMLLPCAAAQAPPVEDRSRDTTLSEGRPGTPSGETISDIWIQVIWVSAAIFLLVTILLVYALVRWRHRRGEKREVPQIHGSSKLEIAWTIGPALIMVWLLVISYNGLFAIDDPDTNPDVVVEVIGHTFFWEYVYPDGSSSTGGDSVLRLAADQWVQLDVTSADVHHAFKIPGLDVMIDAMPGKTRTVYMNTGSEPGVYLVQCMRFCGPGHGGMFSTVEVFDPDEQELPYGAPPREPADEEDPMDPPDDENATDEENETADVDADRTIDVTLFDMFFDPAPVEMEAGETVEIRVSNDGPSPHDLNFGTYSFDDERGEAFCEDPDNEDTCWMSRSSMPSGEGDSFVITVPDEPIAFNMWCSVPGHVAQGMISYLSVDGAVPEEELTEPRLPGPGAMLLLFALGGFVFVLRRKKA